MCIFTSTYVFSKMIYLILCSNNCKTYFTTKPYVTTKGNNLQLSLIYHFEIPAVNQLCCNTKHIEYKKLTVTILLKKRIPIRKFKELNSFNCSIINNENNNSIEALIAKAGDVGVLHLHLDKKYAYFVMNDDSAGPLYSKLCCIWFKTIAFHSHLGHSLEYM